MTKNCFDNPIVRDGTSQQMRLIRSLLPEYVSVDERNFEELKQFVLEFSREINFFNLNDQPAGDWFSFFNGKVAPEQRTEPHYALFQAFLELFKIAQEDLNTLTRRHLEYFYQDVLRLREKSPVPDQVFVILELARHVSEKGHLIKKGTRLKAGVDALDNNVTYITTDDIVINKAQVASLKGLLKDPVSHRIYGSPMVNSSDGEGGEFETDTQSWRPFGDDSRTAAAVGFSVASPILGLKEGTRTIKIKVEFEKFTSAQIAGLKDLTPAVLNQLFLTYFSGEEAWITPTEPEEIPVTEYDKVVEGRIVSFLNQTNDWKDIASKEPHDGPIHDAPYSGKGDQVRDYDVGETTAKEMIRYRDSMRDRQFNSLVDVRAVRGIGVDKIEDMKFSFRNTFKDTVFDFSNNTLTLTRTIAKDQEPIVGYNQKALLDPINTALPVAKVILNTDPDQEYIYDRLVGLKMKSVCVDVDVVGVRSLVVQNDQTVMDPAKTIQPFGIVPVLGSNFYVGNQEVFQKQLDYLKVNIDWYGLPTGEVTEGSDTYYGFDGHYRNFVNRKTNTSFKARISVLDKKSWVDIGENINLFADQDNIELDPARVLEFKDNTTLQAIERDEELEPFTDFNISSRKGFLRFELTGSDFAHKDFPPSFTRQVLQGLNDPNVPLPREPYTPLIEGVSLDYQSSICIDLTGNQEGCSTDSKVEQYFHMEPFGVNEVDGCESGQKSFLPVLAAEGEFFIGLEKLAPAQNISLLIQLLEGSEDPTVLKPTVNWSYLANNQWIPFEQFDLLSDSTNGLVRSGLVNLAVPKAASANNTVMPGGLHWLKVSVANSSQAIPAFIQVVTQAVSAVFEDNGNDPNYLANALPANSIAKLQFSDSSVAGISQPFASFGGKVREQNNAYYQRVSERLRHKQRAITIWDYERLVLEEFAAIYKTKCLNHTRFTGKRESFSQVAPGHVSLIVVPNVQNRNAVDLIRPQTSLNTLTEIKDYLELFNGPAINLNVQNPIYEDIQVNFKVRFRQGFDIGFYKRQLEDEIKAFLSPWAYNNTPDITFGGKIHQSVILNFVDERPYVDYVTCFEMIHWANGIPTKTAEAIASTTASILCSFGQISQYGNHSIDVLEDDTACGNICDDNVIDPPPQIASADSCCEEEEDKIGGGITTDDLYDYSAPVLDLCPEPEDSDECNDGLDGLQPCILSAPNDHHFFQPYKGSVRLLQTNAVYLLPGFSHLTVNLPVKEVVDNRTIKIAGDWTAYTSGYAENSYNTVDNPHFYQVMPNQFTRGVEFDGEVTTIRFSNKDHQIKEGDRVVLYKKGTVAFENIYLPEVDEEMVNSQRTIKLQAIATGGKEIYIKRKDNDTVGPPRGLRLLDASSADIVLRSGVEKALYSVALQASKLDDDYGWKIVAENQNYYQGCIDEGQIVDWGVEIPVVTPPAQISVLKDADDATYFIPATRNIFDEEPRKYPVIRQVNMTYLLPKSMYRTVKVPVLEILSARTVALGADLSMHDDSSNRLENLMVDANSKRFKIRSAKKVEDLRTHVTLTSNIGEALKPGDFVNVFRNTNDQFKVVYLPKVTEAMVKEQAYLQLMKVTSGPNVTIVLRRSEEDGKDRLQRLGDKRDYMDKVVLKRNPFSVKLVATEFPERNGYNRYGWKVVEENENYYAELADPLGNELWDNRYEREEDDDDDDDRDDDDRDDDD